MITALVLYDLPAHIDREAFDVQTVQVLVGAAGLDQRYHPHSSVEESPDDGRTNEASRPRHDRPIARCDRHTRAPSLSTHRVTVHGFTFAVDRCRPGPTGGGGGEPLPLPLPLAEGGT